MIDQTLLTADLRKFLEKDLLPALRRRAAAETEIDRALRAEHTAAKAAGRTGFAFEVWRDDHLTQVGVAWVLGCVIIRFMEDNGLVDAKDSFPRIAGPGPALRQAQDQHEAYFKQHPTLSDRDYLLAVFTDAGKLRGCHELFSKEHNPLWAQGGVLMDADAASRLIAFFQQLKTASAKAELVHDFTDPTLGTRFLGDLYQNLSEAARKKYALLQTPVFVEEFILDRTLEPAIKEFGLCDLDGRDLSAQKKPIPSDHLLRMIDPTVGSGHFLLGAFERLFAHWQKQEPMTEPAVLAERCLNSLFGVDLNPYAANIARFRLLVAALKACGIKRLREARDWTINIAVGDSLLHGSFAGGAAGGELFEAQVRTDTGNQYVTSAEDLDVLRRFLMPRRYHVVVGNPPYITVKDAALSEAYRRRYGSCHRKYALSVPFFERFFDLAVAPESAEVSKAGFVGKITANSFMKREFGKKLIETFLPRWDLTHVIDTSGAYIPGHGTPTVILFGRHRAPVAKTIRAVLGIRGEPSTPEDPATAKVWSAILGQIDRPGSESEFVSVSDAPRANFEKHPWSIGGGGASELKETVEEAGEAKLASIADAIGVMAVPGEDEVFIGASIAEWARFNIPQAAILPCVEGDQLREWTAASPLWAIYPYTASGAFADPPGTAKHYWPLRTTLSNVIYFGKTKSQRGMDWREYGVIVKDKLHSPATIAYGEVACHNHFVFDRGGRVFKQTAPVIKLPANATEDEHLALVGLLNSGSACFWMRQVCFPKGGDHVGNDGARVRRSLWDERHAFNATNLDAFPVPWAEGAKNPLRAAVMAVARDIDTLAQARAKVLPAALLAAASPGVVTRSQLDDARKQATLKLQHMIALQEELDWLVYRAYGLLEDTKAEHPPAADAPPINLGERAFEIVMARKMEAGTLNTEWFRRHGSTPITAIPTRWPAAYKKVVEHRIALIEAGAKQNKDIALIEQPEYKRRWNTEKWDEMEERALREWLLDRLEWGTKMPSAETTNGSRSSVWDEREPRLMTASRLADKMRGDEAFRSVAALYAKSHAAPDDLTTLVQQLVEAESVPFLPVLRYKETGLRNRAIWERTWELQREEDRLEALREKARAKMKAASEAMLAKLPKKEAEEARASEKLLTALLKDDATWNATKAELDAVPANPVIEVPPRYASKDFQNANFWRLRGKLDVPKERFVSFPHCGPDGDETTLITWAGFDHRQQAQAITMYYTDKKANAGWDKTGNGRFVPLLGGLAELVPWLKQWHNTPDANGHNWAEVIEGFIADEARELGLTAEQIKAWTPPAVVRRGRKAGGRQKKAAVEQTLLGTDEGNG